MNYIKYIHTNIIARDWRKLAQFYMDVFDCKPVLPERDLSGDWLNKLTNIEDVKVTGVHLTLPGYNQGPTIEIFEYDTEVQRSEDPKINTQGFAHIAFRVDKVEEMIEKVLMHGGSKYGEMVQEKIPGVGLLKVIYVKDIEGNIIEIQSVKNYD